jgi:hypothetical protein
MMMKFKVYEVELEWDDIKNGDRQSFLYANYEDAVAKFKELVEQQKKVDWIEEGLTEGNGDGYEYELTEQVDYWCFSRDYFLDHCYSAVTIEERKVF